MNPERLRKAIVLAMEAVSTIEDKEIKLKSYEVILNNLLKEGSAEKLPMKLEKNMIDTNLYSLLASKLNLKEELVKDYLDLGDEPKLLFNVKRNNAIEEQIVFLLSFLTINKICYGEKDIKSSELRRILAEHKISAINNLSTNVKKFDRFIVHRAGKIGSTNTSYRITEEGFSKGLTILSQILEGKNSLDINLDFLGLKILKRNKYNSKAGEEINKLLKEGFFNEYKKVKEVVSELKTRGFFNRRQDIDAYLRKSLLGKSLLRNKINGIWAYVLKK
jgi:predicted nucleic acid-binding protein